MPSSHSQHGPCHPTPKPAIETATGGSSSFAVAAVQARTGAQSAPGAEAARGPYVDVESGMGIGVSDLGAAPPHAGAIPPLARVSSPAASASVRSSWTGRASGTSPVFHLDKEARGVGEDDQGFDDEEGGADGGGDGGAGGVGDSPGRRRYRDSAGALQPAGAALLDAQRPAGGHSEGGVDAGSAARDPGSSGSPRLSEAEEGVETAAAVEKEGCGRSTSGGVVSVVRRSGAGVGLRSPTLPPAARDADQDSNASSTSSSDEQLSPREGHHASGAHFTAHGSGDAGAEETALATSAVTSATRGVEATSVGSPRSRGLEDGAVGSGDGSLELEGGGHMASRGVATVEEAFEGAVEDEEVASASLHRTPSWEEESAGQRGCPPGDPCSKTPPPSARLAQEAV